MRGADRQAAESLTSASATMDHVRPPLRLDTRFECLATAISCVGSGVRRAGSGTC